MIAPSEMEALARKLWGEPNPHLSNKRELRWGAKGSKKVMLANCTWYDHEADKGGGYNDLYRLVHKTEPPRNGSGHSRQFRPPPGMERELGQPVVWWDYHDANGTTLARVVRFEPPGAEKTYRQCRPDGDGWKWSTAGIQIPLYRLPDILQAPRNSDVFLPEGEKCADLLREWGLVATTNAGGAKKFRDCHAKTLADLGCRCIVLPDNDVAGLEHEQVVVKELRAAGCKDVRVIRLPDLPPKGDVVDWAAAGGTREQLAELLGDAKPNGNGVDHEPAPEAEQQQEEPSAQEPSAPAPCDPTEDAVAQQFADTYKGRLAYDHTEETWFIWRRGRWNRDGRNVGFHTARMFTRKTRNNLPEPPRSLTKIAFSASVERAARADPQIALSHEVWNTDPWLLGTPGGVVDLRTGELSSARPDLYISRYTSVTPAPRGTPAPIWSKFLKAATKDDKEFQGFLHRLSGYVLTGDVSEEVLTFLYGPGGNGKGTFLTVLIGIMDDYAISVPIEVFTAGSRINLEYYRAQMAGARLVTASETEAQATWAEAQIKEITGNDTPLSGRHPRGRPFTFRSQAKIMIVGNHAPKLRGRSPAMERRLRVAPFTHMPAAPDHDLKDKLRAEYPAILRRMIDGCVEWQRTRLGTCKAIGQATSAYFEQQDAFGRWMDERCIVSRDKSTKPGQLLADFNAWAKENGEDQAGKNGFAELLDRTPSLERSRSNGVRFVKGIALRTDQKDLPLGRVDQ